MFTNKPGLSRRIERVISETPIVGPYTHTRRDQPDSLDLASLMSYNGSSPNSAPPACRSGG